MPSFVSQFGAALLAVQEELRRSVDRSGGMPQVANVVIVSLDRETFLREQKGAAADLELFRSDLTREINAFLASNEWSVSNPLSLNLLLRSITVPCAVRVERRDALYTLTIRDDSGRRTVPVRRPVTVLGREHEAPPRAFVPVRDGSRALSREHLLLTFRDLELRAVLQGRNPTTLNNQPMLPHTEYVLRSGDLIRCGPHTIEVDSVDSIAGMVDI